MAHFKMRVQIREQSSAFVRGFKSIIAADWLDMFSTPELQKLIAGDAADVDIDDLRYVMLGPWFWSLPWRPWPRRLYP